MWAVAVPAVVSAFQLPADDFGPQLRRQLARFYARANPEKVYLHFDKDAYAVGETVWFKGYVAAAAALPPDSLSRVLYVDVIGPDQQVMAHQALAVRAGGAPGSYQLPATLPEGLYTVRAYTNWMRNSPDYLFTRVLPVVAANEGGKGGGKKPAVALGQVQFFPEGGELISGLPTVVAFKATDADGRGLDVQGTVVDEQGTEVAQLRSQHLGMGRFELLPGAGRRYTTRISYADGARAVFPLPATLPVGLALQVQEQAEDYRVLVRRKAGPGDPPAERVTLAAHVHGTVAYAGQAEVSEARPLEILVPKQNLPAGILHFTVFDGQQVARCERLGFHMPRAGAQLQVQPDKPAYEARDKVTLRVVAQDAAGRPLAGNFSLAVSNAAAPQLTNGLDIRTGLLLTADLPGPVEQPGYYFAARNAATARALDDLLLTQGWRRFVWKTVLAEPAEPLRYAREASLSLSGRVVDKKLAPVPGATVIFTRLQPAQTRETQTDAQGRFRFGGFGAADTAAVRLEVQTGRGGRPPQILLDDHVPAVTAASGALWPWATDSARQAFGTVQKQLAAGMNGKSILLNNVTVQDRAAAGGARDMRRIYGRPDVRLLTKDIAGITTYQNVLQVLQGRVAGVNVVSSRGNVRVTMRGKSSTESTRLGPALQTASGGAAARGRAPVPAEPTAEQTPLLLLDGVPTDVSMLNSVPAADFEAIEILRPGSAAIFGELGSAGAIAFLTKRGNPAYVPGAEPPPAVLPPLYYPPRLQRVREFYTPPAPAAGSAAPRTGATLYWNASVQTGADGQATVSFVADKAGTFRVVAEGLTRPGEPLRATGLISVAAPK